MFVLTVAAATVAMIFVQFIVKPNSDWISFLTDDAFQSSNLRSIIIASSSDAITNVEGSRSGCFLVMNCLSRLIVLFFLLLSLWFAFRMLVQEAIRDDGGITVPILNAFPVIRFLTVVRVI